MKDSNSKQEVLYGIYNTLKKEFQFGIAEPTEKDAYLKLKQKIGQDARKWRFEPRVLDPNVPGAVETLAKAFYRRRSLERSRLWAQQKQETKDATEDSTVNAE